MYMSHLRHCLLHPGVFRSDYQWSVRFIDYAFPANSLACFLKFCRAVEIPKMLILCWLCEKQRGGCEADRNGWFHSGQTGEIWPLPTLYGNGWMVSKCEAYCGATGTCVASGQPLSSEARPCRGGRGYRWKLGALWCRWEWGFGPWGSLGNWGHWANVVVAVGKRVRT